MKKVLIFGVILVTAAMLLAVSFKDVPSDHWATAYINKLVNAGVVNGYPDGTFKGRRYVTRYEMTAFVARTIDYMEKVLNVQTSSLKNDIALVNAKTKTLQGDVEMLRNSLASLAKTVLQLKQNGSSAGSAAECKILEKKLENLEKSFMRFRKGTYTDVKLLKESMTKLNQKMADVEAKVKDMESRLDDTVSYLYDEIDSTKEQVNLLTEGLQALREDIESEYGSGKTADIDKLDKKIADLEKKLSDLKYNTLTDMGFVKKGVMGNAKNIGMLLKKTSALQSDVIALKSEVDSLKKGGTELKELKALKEKVDWVSNKVLENDQIMKVYKGKIEGLETRIASLSKKIEELDSKIAKSGEDTKESVKKVESSVKSLDTKATVGMATGATGSVLAIVALLKVFGVF